MRREIIFWDLDSTLVEHSGANKVIVHPEARGVLERSRWYFSKVGIWTRAPLLGACQSITPGRVAKALGRKGLINYVDFVVGTGRDGGRSADYLVPVEEGKWDIGEKRFVERGKGPKDMRVFGDSDGMVLVED